MQRLLAVFVLGLSVLPHQTAAGEDVVRSSASIGVITAVDVDAAAEIEVQFWPKGADYRRDEHEAFRYKIDWVFTWPATSPTEVSVAARLEFGDYFTVTDGGSLAGVTRQSFEGMIHNTQGTAHWDEPSHTLSMEFPVGERDVGGATSVSMSSEPRCDKIKGWSAGAGCNAFLESSPEMEGLHLELVFDQSLSQFQGSLVLIQYGGSGFSKSRSEITTLVQGEVEAVEP